MWYNSRTLKEKKKRNWSEATNLAGYCLMTYAEKGDKKYIVAMCHADRGPQRFIEQNNIYNYLFK